MNRDEFMELVYETFADEPDNVLANGIIEAADAYVEHEKTQTVERLRGVVEITVPITDYDGGYIDGIETGISTVSTMPTAQPKSAIPLSWIVEQIEWLKGLDNAFSTLTATQVSAMVKKWRDEHNETD